MSEPHVITTRLTSLFQSEQSDGRTDGRAQADTQETELMQKNNEKVWKRTEQNRIFLDHRSASVLMFGAIFGRQMVLH